MAGAGKMLWTAACWHMPLVRARHACRALLAAHPEEADILAAELDRAELLVTHQRPEPRGMIFSDLASLTYLDGVIQQLESIIQISMHSLLLAIPD